MDISPFSLIYGTIPIIIPDRIELVPTVNVVIGVAPAVVVVDVCTCEMIVTFLPTLRSAV